MASQGSAAARLLRGRICNGHQLGSSCSDAKTRTVWSWLFRRGQHTAGRWPGRPAGFKLLAGVIVGVRLSATWRAISLGGLGMDSTSRRLPVRPPLPAFSGRTWLHMQWAPNEHRPIANHLHIALPLLLEKIGLISTAVLKSLKLLADMAKNCACKNLIQVD